MEICPQINSLTILTHPTTCMGLATLLGYFFFGGGVGGGGLHREHVHSQAKQWGKVTFSNRSVLRPISTQENKHGIGPDRNKIEPAHGLSVPIFCSSLNL